MIYKMDSSFELEDVTLLSLIIQYNFCKSCRLAREIYALSRTYSYLLCLMWTLFWLL